MRIPRLAPVLCLAALLIAQTASADLLPYEGDIRLIVSEGLSLSQETIVDASFSGLADIDTGLVQIAASAFSVPVNGTSFGGVLVNGPLSFQFGGAATPPPCTPGTLPTFAHAACISGFGFGGVMPLSGVTQLGQGLSAWGSGANTTSLATSIGLPRVVMGPRWTTGFGAAFFIVPEVTPFTQSIASVGSFMGLPTTFTGSEPGFRVVTPMVVKSSLPTSLYNARGIAIMTIRFVPQPVPLAGAAVLAGALASVGYMLSRRRNER